MPPAVGRLAGTHALLIGVERYGLGRDAQLDGPAHAVCEMAEWLVARGAAPGNLLVHVSPKIENKAVVLERLAALEIAHQEATESQIRDTVIQGLANRNGDALLVYWCGHGFVEGEFERRLFCADATQDDWRHIRFFDLLRYLQMSPAAGFQRHVGIRGRVRPVHRWRASERAAGPPLPSPAGAGAPQPGRDPYVVLSTGHGQFATGAEGTGGLPLFTRHLLDELKADALDLALDVEGMKTIDERLQQRFDALNAQKLADQIPSHYYARDWKGSPLPSAACGRHSRTVSCRVAGSRRRNWRSCEDPPR